MNDGNQNRYTTNMLCQNVEAECMPYVIAVFSCSFNVQLTRKARLTSAQRHAKRSAEYWERNGALEYAKDGVGECMFGSRETAEMDELL